MAGSCGRGPNVNIAARTIITYVICVRKLRTHAPDRLNVANVRTIAAWRCLFDT